MILAYESVTTKQLKGHVISYTGQALLMLIVMSYGWYYELSFWTIFRPMIVIIVATYLVGSLVNRLSAAQQGGIAVKAMLVKFPPALNAVAVIAVFATYAFWPLVGIIIWVAICALEGGGFYKATRNWDDYLARVNADAR
jgi:hypothetical protein